MLSYRTLQDYFGDVFSAAHEFDADAQSKCFGQGEKAFFL